MLGSEVKIDNNNENQTEDQKPPIHIKLHKTILNFDSYPQGSLCVHMDIIILLMNCFYKQFSKTPSNTFSYLIIH